LEKLKTKVNNFIEINIIFLIYDIVHIVYSFVDSFPTFLRQFFNLILIIRGID